MLVAMSEASDDLDEQNDAPLLTGFLHGDEVHEAQIRPRPKFDTPTGLFGGACICGWKSGGLESESGAWKSASQHVAAKARAAGLGR